jgi:hypothetical protein
MNMIKEHDNIKTCMLFGITIFSFSFSFFIYRKLKFINVSNKNIENFRKSIHQVQQIRDKVSMNTAPVARRSNPLVRFITNFTGLSNTGDDKNERRPSTAEAGSQVCHEIIAKREKRRNVPQNDEGEETPREGFVQEMFGSSSSSSCCGSTQADQKTSETHTCSVCLDEDIILGSGNTTMTECGHVFHLTCLLKSLCQKNLCPMCRAPLEDVREKQMPANVLTPVSAEQIIAEEISYFSNAAHVQSITSSRHPKRCFKEALRVFGFTLLRTVAEYVHGENMPVGWYDDGESESETEDEGEDDDDQNSEDQGDQGDDQNSEDQGDQGDQDDEFNYAYASRASRGDLRDSIGR